MATIKLEILLDSNEQTDVLAFSNLMNAFSGAPSVQYLSSGFPVEALKRTLEAQSPSTANKVTASEAEQIAETTKEEEYQNGYEYSEAEMLKLPNTDLKDYATGLGIDWAKAEGKNTNRKLADLVLAFRNGGAKDEESPATEVVKDEALKETAEDLTKEDDLGGEKLTYNDLKLSLGKKVDEHREAIVAKLAEYGATKMPNLAEEHWTDMFNFMEAL
jgi:hypothetical protein